MKRTWVVAVALLAVGGLLFLGFGDVLFPARLDVADPEGAADTTLRDADEAGGPGLASRGARPGGSSQASLALDAAEIEPPTGRVTGTVFDAAGRPLPGATVALRTLHEADGRSEPPHAPRGTHAFLTVPDLARTTSAEDGSFGLAEAPDGPLWLVVSKAEHVTVIRRIQARDGLPVGGPVDVVVPHGPAETLRVRDARGRGEAGVIVAVGPAWWGGPSHIVGLARTDAGGDAAYRLRPGGDPYEMLLAKAERPLLMVAFPPEGAVAWPPMRETTLRLVAASTQKPLGGARVEIIGTTLVEHMGMLVTWGRTDAAGELTVSVPRSQLTRIRGHHGAVGRFQRDFPTHAQQRTHAVWMPDPDGEVIVVPIGESGHAVIEGRVTDPEGEPVAGAQVLLHASGGGPLTALSGEDGRYRIAMAPRRLAAGGRLLARARGFAPFTRELEPMPERATHTEPIELSAGVALVGRVIDGDGRPVAGARVQTTAHQTTLVLPPAPVAPLAPAPVPVPGDEVEVPPAAEAPPVEEVPPAPFGEPVPVPVQDVVEASPFPPPPIVYPSPPMLHPGVWQETRHDMSVHTDAQGRYVLPGLPAGEEVMVFAEHSRLQAGQVTLTVGRGPRQRVPDIRLARGRALTVRVLDPAGRPVERALVRLAPGDVAEHLAPLDMQPPSMHPHRRTDAEGRARFRGCPDRVHTLIVTADGTAGRLHPLDAAARSAAEVVVRLRRSGVLEGRVVDHKGRPLGGVDLAFHYRPGVPRDATTWMPYVMHRVEDDGRFRIHDAPEGLDLTAHAVSALCQDAQLEVRSGQRGIEIRMTPHDVEAYDKLQEARDTYMAAYNRPRPDAPEAAAAHDERLRKLYAIWAKLEERYIGEHAASCGGHGRGCG